MPLNALRALIRRLFSADDFRRFLLGLPGCDDEVRALLPSTGASLEMLLDVALEALERRGLLGMSFFVELVLQRYNRLTEIAVVAKAFGFHLSAAEIAAQLIARETSLAEFVAVAEHSLSLDRLVHHAVTLALAERCRLHDGTHNSATDQVRTDAGLDIRLSSLAERVRSNEARHSWDRPNASAHPDALRLCREIEANVGRAEAHRAVLRLMDLAQRFAPDRALLRAALLLSARVETWRKRKALLSDSTACQEWISLLEEILTLADTLVDATADRSESTSTVMHRGIESTETEPLQLDHANSRNGALIYSAGLSKRYANQSRFALRDISVTIFPRTILGVVGPNGAGKTTLLRILGGELRADAGTLCYPRLGELTSGEIDWHRVRAQISYVHQRPEPWRGRLAEHLSLWAATCRIFGQDNVDMVDFYLERLGLARYRDALWSEISGGYQTRAALARALVGRPRLLLLDEPLAPLDVRAQYRFLQDLSDIASNTGPGIILSSQHIPEIEMTADAMLCLNEDGTAWFQGSRSELGQRGERLYEFSGDISDTLRQKLWAIFGRTSLKEQGRIALLRTPQHFNRADVVTALSEAGAFPAYLREITESTVRIFWEMSYD